MFLEVMGLLSPMRLNLLERLTHWKNKLEELKKSDMRIDRQHTYFRMVQYLYDYYRLKFMGLD